MAAQHTPKNGVSDVFSRVAVSCSPLTLVMICIDYSCDHPRHYFYSRIVGSFKCHGFLLRSSYCTLNTEGTLLTFRCNFSEDN